MSDEKKTHFSPIIFSDEKVVVRGHHENGEFRIYIHSKVDGYEQVPLGYMLGDSCLHYKVRIK